MAVWLSKSLVHIHSKNKMNSSNSKELNMIKCIKITNIPEEMLKHKIAIVSSGPGDTSFILPDCNGFQMYRYVKAKKICFSNNSWSAI